MFKKINFQLEYIINDHIITLVTDKSIENDDLKVFISQNNIEYDIVLKPQKKIQIQNAFLSFPYMFESNQRIYLNGYQSWAISEEVEIDHKMHGINHLPRFLVKKYGLDVYGDYHFVPYSNKKGIFHSHTYSYIRQNDQFTLFGSLNEETGFTIIKYCTPNNQINICKDTQGLFIDREYPLFKLCCISGSYDKVFDDYFRMMKIDKPNVKPLCGYTSWYNHYQNINEKIILEDFKGLLKVKDLVDVFQIDDGYQTAVGDWLSIDQTKFPNGLKEIADKIKEQGLIPGLWLAPFVCEKKSWIFQNKPEWLLKDKNNEPLYCGSNWSGFYALDFYNEEVRDYLKKCFNTIINEWGFSLVKLDFLYSVCILPQHHLTRGAIMCEAMTFLREIVGDKLIIGCGVPLAPSFGKVDFCRIGADVSLQFDGPFYMRLIGSERPSTKNAMINSLYRRHLNQRAFNNDPDVFLLRKNNIMLTEQMKENLAFVNCISGSLLFTSDNINEYDEKQLALLKQTYKNIDNKLLDVVKIDKLKYEITYLDNNIQKKKMIVLNKGELV